MRPSTIPLLLLAVLTFFVGLGRGAITDSDEAFYAEAAREMVESGDWLTPHYNYEARFQKPILYYWLTAATYAVTGAGEASARLWSAASGVGLVLLAAACGRRWFDESIGLVAGGIVATNFGYFAIARMALPDLPLAFLISLAIFAAFIATLDQERRPRRWVLLSALAMGLAFLMKGPVGVILPALVVVPIVLLERHALNLSTADVILGALVFLIVGVPWYAAMWAAHGTAYLESFFVGDNIERFATERFNDARPWWFYLPIIAGGLLPWTPLAVTCWIGPAWQFLTRRRDLGTLDLRLLLWASLPLLFYTVSVGKQPRYVLPVLPPLAVLLAGSLVERTREWRSLDGARVRPRPSGAIVVGGLTSGALLVGLGALLFRAQPLLINVADAFTLGGAAVTALAGVAVMIVALSPAWRATAGALAVAGAVSLVAFQFGALSGSGDDTVQQVARVVRAEGVGHEEVGSYRVFVRNLVFYTGLEQVDLITDEQLTGFLASPNRVVVVLPDQELRRYEAERGTTLRRLASWPYFNESGARLRTLLWPALARDVQTVVLVSNR
ncbi:MAG: glycosyltransferase family 39 protein [Acidobacteriota bacterium]